MTDAGSAVPLKGLQQMEILRSQRKLFNCYGQIHDPAHPEIRGAYPWQVEFHNAGAHFKERALMAANQIGKSECGAAEIACHATGEYPPWWEGRRFNEAIRAWIGSETMQASRDTIQYALLGPPSQWGTGWIPASRIVGKPTLQQAGVTNVVESIMVRHSSGGVSQISLKTYEQDRRKWQGVQLHVIWFDEQPPLDIYTEGLTRILVKNGIAMMTFTPLDRGLSETVKHLLDKDREGIFVKNVTWDDAPHLTAKMREEMLGRYPAWEIDARSKGQPMFGKSVIFPLPDEAISIPPFPLPDHYYRINGCDFGIDHPAAGAFLAGDRDADTWYLYDCYKMAGETAVYHADALKKHGIWIPIAWPHDGLERDRGESGIALKDHYRRHGAFMLKEHAHYPDDRGNSREPGLIEMYEYMRTGKLKVFSHLSQFFEEKRFYHRESKSGEAGKTVAKNDDIISAARYAWMMRRYARVPPQKIRPQVPGGPIMGRRRWEGASA